jgi:hypothetical protein
MSPRGNSTYWEGGGIIKEEIFKILIPLKEEWRRWTPTPPAMKATGLQNPWITMGCEPCLEA